MMVTIDSRLISLPTPSLTVFPGNGHRISSRVLTMCVLAQVPAWSRHDPPAAMAGHAGEASVRTAQTGERMFPAAQVDTPTLIHGVGRNSVWTRCMPEPSARWQGPRTATPEFGCELREGVASERASCPEGNLLDTPITEACCQAGPLHVAHRPADSGRNLPFGRICADDRLRTRSYAETLLDNQHGSYRDWGRGSVATSPIRQP